MMNISIQTFLLSLLRNDLIYPNYWNISNNIKIKPQLVLLIGSAQHLDTVIDVIEQQKNIELLAFETVWKFQLFYNSSLFDIDECFTIWVVYC